jgi:hypothetical protein
MGSRSLAMRGTLALLLIAATVTACDSAQPTDAPSASSSTRAEPATTIDPQAEPAIAAYNAFAKAAQNAERAPRPLGSDYPSAADFTRYSFDPLRSEFLGYVASLAEQDIQFRGAPPTSNVTVTSVDLRGKPYPTVTLSDCPTGTENWQAYDSAGKQLPVASPSSAPPPYLITAKVIFYKERWGVQSTTADTSRTCVAQEQR